MSDDRMSRCLAARLGYIINGNCLELILFASLQHCCEVESTDENEVRHQEYIFIHCMNPAAVQTLVSVD